MPNRSKGETSLSSRVYYLSSILFFKSIRVREDCSAQFMKFACHSRYHIDIVARRRRTLLEDQCDTSCGHSKLHQVLKWIMCLCRIPDHCQTAKTQDIFWRREPGHAEAWPRSRRSRRALPSETGNFRRHFGFYVLIARKVWFREKMVRSCGQLLNSRYFWKWDVIHKWCWW